jgi:hypothetical protein
MNRPSNIFSILTAMLVAIGVNSSAHAQVGVGMNPPADAEVLFDGTRESLDSNWEYWEGPCFTSSDPIKWNVVRNHFDGGEGHALTSMDPYSSTYGQADIVTNEKYRDFRFHVEFLIPRGGGNSGVYLDNRYEIQVVEGEEGPHGMAAVINEKEAPYELFNGLQMWNAYDIQFRGARFDANGERTERAMVTMYFNGEKVHENVPINQVWGGVCSAIDGGNDGGERITPDPGGVKLQAEGHDVRYRNIWMQEMNFEQPDTDF